MPIIKPDDSAENEKLVQPATVADMKKVIASGAAVPADVAYDSAERIVLEQMGKTADDFSVLNDEAVLAGIKTNGDIDKWYSAIDAKIKSMSGMAALMKNVAAREKAEEIIKKMQALLEFVKTFRNKTATQHVAEMGSGASNNDAYESVAAMAHHYDEGEKDDRFF